MGHSSYFKVSKIFLTIQGEGKLQGTPSVLIRFFGCNLNCVWCDTIQELEKVKCFTLDQILVEIEKWHCKNLILTGGEPMLQPEISDLTFALKQRGYHITIETNGTIKKKVYADLLSISPKLKHSENKTKTFYYNIISYYVNNYNFQLKFVVNNKKSDFDEVLECLKCIPQKIDMHCVYAMPMASTRASLKKIENEIVKLCIQYGFTYCDRLQLQIWGDEEQELQESRIYYNKRKAEIL